MTNETEKYLYREPRRSREHLEAISFELRGTAKNGKSRGPRSTIQDHLAEIVSLAREAALERKWAPMKVKMAETSALYALAIICGFITWYGSGHAASGWDWLDAHRFALKTWGVALSAVFVGIHVERTGLASVVWRYSVTKFLASIGLSALVIYSAGRAASVVNGVFGIDAGALPYTRTLLTGWIAFTHLAWPLMLIVGLIWAWHLFIVLAYFWYRARPSDDASSPTFSWHSLGVVIMTAVVFGNISVWLFRTLDDTQLPTKVYQLARILDFNGKHTCTNLPPRASVVFIGPDQNKVLIDSNSQATPGLEEFFGREASEWETPPERFAVIDCLAAPAP
jgi:hypothetical protein